MGVVLLDVNWSRKWDCAGFEHAQLDKIVFENVATVQTQEQKYREIQLDSPSQLFVTPEFKSYGFLVSPGTYAFTEWSVKVAKTSNEVGSFTADRSELVEGEIYHGGAFDVNAGEVIYIGNFFMDCFESPIPWRYYTQGGEQLQAHFQAFKSKFRFLKEREIVFRLLDTKNFGTDVLATLNLDANVEEFEGNYQYALELYEQGLVIAQEKNDNQYEALAMYGIARANGHLCRPDEAISWFEKSISLRKSIPDSKGVYISQNYLELARLEVSLADWERAQIHYELAIPVLETHDMQSTDPIGYANILKSYVEVLEASGYEIKAKEFNFKIADLVERNPDKTAVFVAKPYPNRCD